MKKNTRTKKKPTYVCYTGFDAQKKSPTHTQEEFMEIMNRKSNKSKKDKYLPSRACAEYIASLSCKPCVKYNKNVRKSFKKSLRNPNFKTSDKYRKKQKKLLLKCSKCKKKSKKKCEFEDFLKYSGAIKGKCRSQNNRNNKNKKNKK